MLSRKQEVITEHKVSKAVIQKAVEKAKVDPVLLSTILEMALELALVAISLISNPVVATILRIIIGGAKLEVIRSKALDLKRKIEE